MYLRFVAIVVFIGLCGWTIVSLQDPPNTNWQEYLGGPDRNHYSELTQINTENVKQLKQVWQFHTGDSGQIQCNPIVIDGVMYAMTAATIPFALDAASGKLIWRKKESSKFPWYSTSRGVVFWQDAIDQKQKRILYTNESFLYALDATTGEPILTFGDSGKTSLKAGLGPTAKDKFVISNTPGTVFEDLIIMPIRVSEGADAALGNVQAFNIKTGKLAWVFKTIPSPGEAGYNTWPKDAYKNTNVGGGNSWAGMAVDRKRGIVFVPTGSAAFDFYGGDRKGDNLYANSLLALDAKTGKRIWHFQAVHHDVLDRDFPSPPNLVTVEQNGKKIDAVAQITKQGLVFLFDRITGKPLFDIKEIPAPASTIPGEYAPATQPFPVKPAPFARQTLDENGISPIARNREELIATLKKSRSEGPFTPLSKEGTIVYPGLDGGGEWGGAAVDPGGIMYVNSNEMAWLMKLAENTPPPKGEPKNAGKDLYTMHCSSCHGADRSGNAKSGYPSIQNVGTKLKREQVALLINKGKAMMPAFKQLSKSQINAVVAYIYGDKPVIVTNAATTKNLATTRYKVLGYNKFLDKDGLPAIAPPWGTLNAIDLNTGEYLWKITYGEYPELMAKGIPQTGAESYGGPVATAGGLLFIGGTKDGKFRAYNKKTGELLWETKLPSASFATPATYAINGKQYIVIACGGTKMGAPKGDSYVAFALE
jgi:quinoprotein glucose dehydrogenase